MALKYRVNLTPINYHLLIGFVIRVVLSVYSIFHDRYFTLPYTDVDYKVFTSAAREILAQRSPYEQEGYRYSPINAYLLMANILVHPVIGKIFASIFDVLIAYMIYEIVQLIYNCEKKSIQCAQLWLYNPLPIIISTRGNLDSLSSFFVLLTVLYQLRKNYYVSGACLAVSTHLRVYPLIFTLPLFITAGGTTEGSTLKKTYKEKLKLVISFAAILAALTGFFYNIYGAKFIKESIWYHVYRTDPQHNFSLFFYLQYLNSFVPSYISNNFVVLDTKTTKALLTYVPQIISLLAVSFKYNTVTHLPFNLYVSVFVFIVFNKVLTAQYFMWSFSLLPLFLPTITLSINTVSTMIIAWLLSLGSWLVSAYLLEFQGFNTFTAIHVCGLFFFGVNLCIIAVFIKAYNNSKSIKKVQ